MVVNFEEELFPNFKVHAGSLAASTTLPCQPFPGQHNNLEPRTNSVIQDNIDSLLLVCYSGGTDTSNIQKSPDGHVSLSSSLLSRQECRVRGELRFGSMLWLNGLNSHDVNKVCMDTFRVLEIFLMPYCKLSVEDNRIIALFVHSRWYLARLWSSLSQDHRGMIEVIHACISAVTILFSPFLAPETDGLGMIPCSSSR